MSDENLKTAILIGAVVVLVMVAGAAVYMARDRLLGGDTDEPLGEAGILDAMRGMRDRGEISEAEYRQAQAAVVAKATSDRDERPPPGQNAASKARTTLAIPGEVRAKPGFDLTGAPLPPAVRDKADGSSGQSR